MSVVRAIPAKKLINDPLDVVNEFIEGLVETYPGLNYLEGFPQVKVVFRADIPCGKGTYDKVAVISGGGGGHEPAHAGFVGEGMLTAAICGDVFSSPPVDSILAGIRAVTGPKGCLLIVKNYTGDRLNFGLAAEEAKTEGFDVETIFVEDDCALPPPRGIAGRRGLAGTVLVQKVAGAAAAAGLSLADVAAEAKHASEVVGTMGVALHPCTLPGMGLADRLGPEKMEYGLGIHGEPGAAVTNIQPVDDVVSHVLKKILSKETNYVPIPPGSRVVLMINGLGATPLMELMIAAGKAVPKLLVEHGMAVERVYTGSFMTSLDMQGFSISIMRADPSILLRLDAETKAPYWPVAVEGNRPPTKLPVPIPPSRSAKSSELVVEVGRDEDGGGVAGETFTDYRPAKVSMGPPHPDSIVETSSLFAVPPPKPTYEPMIKHPLESSKAFSCFQIETFIYACQRHTQHLPDGTRAGFFIGDGGDVGKVRILAGLIWENWHHGRKKALWISVGSDLNVDVRRDLDDIGATCIEVHALDELPYSKLGSKSVGVREGVIFLTYSSLIGCSEKGRTRLQQLVQWCGPGFDGLIIFDECHKAKPLVPEAGKKPTQTCEAVLDIQARLPEARVVYCSAAGTSESRIMAYMVRLDLWGDGTSFCDFGEFPVLMKEKEKKDKVIPTYPDIILPEEMVIEILRRLPVRSLLRFKTVCKRWRLLISNSTFCKSHCDMNYAPTHRLLLEKVDDYEIESFDLQASLHEDSAVVKLKFPPYRAPFFSDPGLLQRSSSPS